MPCAGQNGPITGYSVRYNIQGDDNTNVNITGNEIETTISNLMSFTNYSIQVAAVNNAGTGVYSESILAETSNDKLIGLMCT